MKNLRARKTQSSGKVFRHEQESAEKPELFLVLAVIIIFLLISAGTVFTYAASVESVNTGRKLQRAQELLGGLESVLFLLKDLNVQATDYCRSGNTNAQEKFQRARAMLPRQMRFILDHIDGDETRRRHFRYLQHLTEALETHLTNAVAAKQNGQEENFPAFLIRAGQLLEVVRGRIVISEIEERELLKSRIRSYDSSTQKLANTFLVLGCLILVFIIPLAITLFRYIQTSRKSVAAERRFTRQIIEHAPMGMVRLNRDFEIEDASPVFLSYVGQDIEAIKGKKLWHVVKEFPEGKVTNVDQMDQPLHLKEVQIERREASGGPPSYWNFTLWPIMDGETRRSLLLLVFDTTGSVLLAREKELLNQIVAHDMKSPLIASDYILKAMLSDIRSNLSAEERSLLQSMGHSVRECMSLVKNMLEVSRYEQGVSRVGSEAVRLEQIATSCIEELDAFAKMAAIKIVLEMETAIEPFNSDPVAIRRLLTNLIENAIKFSEKGSQVKVRLVEDERGIHISVADRGPGMETTEVERIFSPYWQGRLGRQTPSGAGIGLYLCRQIATSLGGSIICKSKPGSGSTFCVTFPRVL